MIRLPSKVAALAAGMLMTLACQAQSPTQQPARETPASSTTPSAQSPTVGAWRKVSDAQFNQQYRFSMLPGVVAAGGKRAVYDYQAGKIVCCLVVVGPEISEAELDSNYGIPGPWITDLVNGWNLDAAPYRPRVQLLRAEGALLDYEFSDMADELGGLLLPAQARAVAPRTLELDGQRYSVTRKDVPLASDDGMVHAYALRPAQGGKPLAVEVPYGIY
ncbi:hypothetical protein [Achromobacter sp. AONIH1]|uniref:hypothetical protein n=1 Tax=unclassified Achromobacter TaxID=2626865 RepID=UPI000CD047B3|nr:hypothetical protein [Achromobacter sp. AONIH1]AUT48557.1 hypothetical protein C2U31_22690 [Achromobacter sp. AONIH1]